MGIPGQTAPRGVDDTTDAIRADTGIRFVERYASLRSLLRAAAIVLILPEKTAVCCEACGQAMTFLRATRHPHRARPPPMNATPP